MIIVENIGMVERRYSNHNVKLRKIEDGSLWNDAVDVIPCQFTYEETNISIDDEDVEPEELLDILLGGE